MARPSERQRQRIGSLLLADGQHIDNLRNWRNGSEIHLHFWRITGDSKTMATDPLQSSQPPLSGERYRSGAIAFHWATFALVVIVGVLGLLHDSWPKQTQAFWINIHALIGIVLWVVL